ELLCAHLAERDLDPLHARRVPEGARTLGELGRRKRERLLVASVVTLAVVVSLAVDAAAEPRLGEELLLDSPLFSKVNLSLEDVDFSAPRGRNLALEGLLPSRLVHAGTPAIGRDLYSPFPMRQVDNSHKCPSCANFPTPMRYSRALIPTLKEAPADATNTSHV